MVLATFKDSLNELLKNGAFYIALAIAILIVATIVFLLIYNRNKNK